MSFASLVRAAVLVVSAWCLASSVARANPNDMIQPEGPVLLTVSGNIALRNGPDGARLDRDMLELLGSRTIETTTIWTDGVQHFRGVPLGRLLRALGAQGDHILARSVTEFTVTIPASDWHDDGPIIAFERNGVPMSLRDKGPLWVIYPFDSSPRFRSETIYFRSIWQLDSITVGPEQNRPGPKGMAETCPCDDPLIRASSSGR